MKFPHFFWSCVSLTALVLAGCNSSSDGPGSATLNDPNWSAGQDTMQSISTPFHDNQAGIFALVRGNSQRFLSAQIGDRSFTSASINSTDSYNDITAFRVTQSSNGNTKSDYVIVACSNEGNADIFLASNPGQVDSNDLGSMSSCVSIAAKPDDYTNGTNMKAYIAGNSRLGEITFSVNLFDNSGFDVTAFNSSVSVIPEGSAVEIREIGRAHV